MDEYLQKDHPIPKLQRKFNKYSEYKELLEIIKEQTELPFTNCCMRLENGIIK